MPLYQREKEKITLVKQTNFKNEKELQTLIEQNLVIIFACRFVASEFTTGSIHSGRIDTLALSEDHNPVIIEYKIVESSDLINQSLFYLSWIQDHKGDFQVAVDKALGKKTEVDWSDIRIICISPGFKKYDLHAVQMMGANIELWEYKFYENNAFHLNEVFKNKRISSKGIPIPSKHKNPVMVEAGKKAALTRASGSYNLETHINKASVNIKPNLLSLRNFILGIDEAIEEVPKKFYVAYKTNQNFVCLEVKKKKIVLWLKILPSEITKMPKNARNVTKIGHRGTGDFEYTVNSEADIEKAKKYILFAYKNIGG